MTVSSARGTASGVPFPLLCKVRGVPTPVGEYPFATAVKRNFRFDWAWPTEKLALEVEGAVMKIGRHQRPEGFRTDIEKYNLAVLLGWRVLRCEPRDIRSGDACALVKRALGLS
jgi:hypothetical protein